MSAATIIIIRRKRLVRRFRETGAIDREHAVNLEALGERRSWIFNQMVRHNVFLPAGNDRYFMDERAAVEFLRQRRSRALFMAGIFALLFLLLWLLGLLS